MRIKDEHKQEALVQATVDLVNEIGFAASSVAKIAKRAKVSPATLYIYHTNKEALLVSTYLEIKKSFARAITQGIDETTPVKEGLRHFWFNLFDYALDHGDYFQYAEQFANSPYHDQVDMAALESYFAPLLELIHRGVLEKQIKNVGLDILHVFLFHPAKALANSKVCQEFTPTRENIETAFELAWDAVRL
ncbi:MAG: TetR/AcrR family transcriptional regulator [Desulfobacterales bacterium]|nr:TetR/AcrR family transcriptional regulator [Desulfobacterales bacterium]